MRVFITGICGFVGSTLARSWREHYPEDSVFGMDWLGRRGSEINLRTLQDRDIRVIHADLRAASDFETLPHADLIIDAAANPSILAGVDGMTSSRQLVEHNLVGTINLLEYAKIHQAAFILLSTSRVYSIPALRAIPLRVQDGAFTPEAAIPKHITAEGITEDFSSSSPLSLYGATKLAAEALALEYGHAFGFPVWINRCGVMAGVGQFPRPDQGIFAYWIHSWATRRPLRYLGFGGHGHQVRDCLHPSDLVGILRAQAIYRGEDRDRILNLSGGAGSARSLCQLSTWCQMRFGEHVVIEDGQDRSYDLPWVVLDPKRAAHQWNWKPITPVEAIFEEIARHAISDPRWIDRSS